MSLEIEFQLCEMHLIQTRSLEIEAFPFQPPSHYAILSHTWSDPEFTYRDYQRYLRPPRLAGDIPIAKRNALQKVESACRQAREDGFDLLWVDSYCIDKSNHSELSEAINSMYQWYERADVCYAYLQDMREDDDLESGLSKSRWVMRGWTLQELIAPPKVRFYDATWNYRGNKHDDAAVVSQATGVPQALLLGLREPKHYPVACRLSWAAHRYTTKPEDQAYCLLGLLDVNMSLIYGEGGKAFRRLQAKIIRRFNDTTLFAWEPDSLSSGSADFMSVLAPSPYGFRNCGDLEPFRNISDEMAVTSKGLYIKGDTPLWRVESRGGGESCYVMAMGTRGGNYTTRGGIYLRKIGPSLFYRDGSLPLFGFGSKNDWYRGRERVGYAEDYIMIEDDFEGRSQLHRGYREDSIYVPPDSLVALCEEAVTPSRFWDATDRVFLNPRPFEDTSGNQVLGLKFEAQIGSEVFPLVVFLDRRRKSSSLGPHYLLLLEDECDSQLLRCFEREYVPGGGEGISWSYFEDQLWKEEWRGRLKNSMDQGVETTLGGRRSRRDGREKIVRIEVEFRRGWLPGTGDDIVDGVTVWWLEWIVMEANK